MAAIVIVIQDPARRFALLLLASCLLVTNLYSDWLLGPMVGLLAVIDARSGARPRDFSATTTSGGSST
jgi:hypothetical protein